MTKYYYDTSTPLGAYNAMLYSLLYQDVWPLMETESKKFWIDTQVGWMVTEKTGKIIGISPTYATDKLYLPRAAVDALLDEKGRWKPMHGDMAEGEEQVAFERDENGKVLISDDGREPNIVIYMRRHPTTDPAHPFYRRLLQMPEPPERE